MEITATVLGYLGTLCLVISFQCRRERALFACQMLSGLFFVLHYGLSGDYTGMLMDGVCFVRSLMMVSGRPALTGRIAKYGLCALIAALCALSWEGVFSLFPTVALLASTLALFTGRGQTIRWTQLLCTSPAWLVYNAHVSSIPGLICESLDMASVLLYEARLFRDRRRASRENCHRKVS